MRYWSSFRYSQARLAWTPPLGYGGPYQQDAGAPESRGHIYALDVDSIEMEKTRQQLEHNGLWAGDTHHPETELCQYRPDSRRIRALDFVLADLGVSSMQIDNPSRGFSFKKEGPWTCVWTTLKGEPASERLKGLTQEELTGMLMENSDEPYAEEIARTVMGEIKRGREVATTRLYEMVDRALAFIPGGGTEGGSEEVLPEDISGPAH